MPLILALAFVLASTGVNVHYCPSGDVHVGLFPKLPCGEFGHCDCDCDCCGGKCEHDDDRRDDCEDVFFQVELSVTCPHFEHQFVHSMELPPYFISPCLASFDIAEEPWIFFKEPLVLKNPLSVEVLRI